MKSLEYLAGYFDGEGTINFTKAQKQYPQLRVAVASGDREVLLEFLETFGGSLHQETVRPPQKRQMYRWYIGGAKGQEVLQKLLPYLIAKKIQAGLALIPDFRAGKLGKRLTEQERMVRLEIMAQIRAINQRVTIEQSELN